MASRGINKAIIVGFMTHDPEMAYLPSGVAVTKISVATNESWIDKNTGQPQERTEFHRIEAFGKLAEIMGQYLRKGSQVYIEGSIRTDKWQASDGTDRYSTKIRANQMQMLGGKSDGVANQNNANMSNNGNSGAQASGKQFQTPQTPGDDEFSEDQIPF